jgi:signal-transduction protein with cAMP-binding, CBS, and nucleotidyltransferase domain
VKIDRANRIVDAYFPAGAFVFKKGDPATDFYVVEKGEVEVLRQLEEGKEPEVVAVFGAGDFFGEMALVEERPRNASVRTRTDTEVTVIGKGMFARMSKILAPLSQQINAAIRKRTTMRQKFPQSTAILKTVELKEVIEPLPSQPLSENSAFVAAVAQFQHDKADFFCVVDDKAHLSGVLTRTDLLDAAESIAALPQDQRLGLKVSDIMTRNPLWVTSTESALLVAEMMRERALKRIPVVYGLEDRRIAGIIRLESLMHLVLQKLPALSASDTK